MLVVLVGRNLILGALTLSILTVLSMSCLLIPGNTGMDSGASNLTCRQQYERCNAKGYHPTLVCHTGEGFCAGNQIIIRTCNLLTASRSAGDFARQLANEQEVDQKYVDLEDLAYILTKSACCFYLNKAGCII